MAEHECHDTATTKGSGCGSVAVGGNKGPAIQQFTVDSVLGYAGGYTAYMTAVFTGGTGVVSWPQELCMGPGSVTVTSGTPIAVPGAGLSGASFTLTVSGSLGSVTAGPLFVGAQTACS